MDILLILMVLIITGVCLWIINNYIPLQPVVKKILNIVVVVILIIWLLKEIGVLNYFENLKI
jgi:hypothetical protein